MKWTKIDEQGRRYFREVDDLALIDCNCMDGRARGGGKCPYCQGDKLLVVHREKWNLVRPRHSLAA